MGPNEQSLLLQSGVAVDVITNGGNSRIVYFSKPVRGIELTMEECTSLGNILTTREDLPRPTEVLRRMIRGGFFTEPKDLKTVRVKLASFGVFVKASPLNTLLGKMVSRGEIIRAGKQRLYTYQAPNNGQTTRRI